MATTVPIVSSGMARRRCNYRENPRRCCINIDTQPSVADSSSRTAPFASSTPRSAVHPAKKSKLGSSSFLRIGNQGLAATSFAAAISPTSSVAHNRRLFNRTNIMSTAASAPLLGPGEASPTKKSRERRPSFMGRSSSKKRVSLGASSSAGKNKRKSITRSIQAPLKNVSSKLATMSSKVKRGGGKKSSSKMTQQAAPPTTEYSRYDSGSGSETSSAQLKAVAESSGSLDNMDLSNCNQEAQTPNEDQFCSLEPERQINTSTRLTPLTFDDNDGRVNNIFRSLDVGEPTSSPLLSQDDFSLGKVLSPVVSADSSDQEVSPGTQLVLEGVRSDFMAWCGPLTPVEDDQDLVCGIPSLLETCDLSQEDANRIKFDEALDKVLNCRASGKASTPQTFYDSYFTFVQEEDVRDGKSDMHRSNSSSSIPSICSNREEDCIPGPAVDDIIATQVPQDAANSEEAADSALVWGALSMILGSPAPKSVLLGEKKQKKRTPVNLWQGGNVIEDLDDILSLPEDNIETLCFIAEGDLDDESDNCSIPSVSPEEQLDYLLPNVVDSNNGALSTPKSSDKDIADSTLAWTALTAILGSPAPSSVVRKSVKKERVNLWQDGDESDLLPEINEEEVINEEDHQIDLNELEDMDEDVIDLTEGKAKEKESADSVLTWSALGMFLGSPAPKSVVKKSRKMSREAAHSLWEDGEGEALDTMPSIGLDEDDINSVPSPLSDECHDENVIPDFEELSLTETPLVVNTDKKGAADSALAWTALSALLGSPAPASVVGMKKQNKRSVKNLWDDGNATEEDLDNLLSFAEEGCSPHEDTCTMPILSETYDEDDDDTHSIPSLSGTSDEDYDSASQSPLTLDGSHCYFSTSPKEEKRAADSVLAWSAFAAIMGSPAPKVALPKRKKESRDLWGEEGKLDNGEDFPCIERGSTNVQLIIDVWEGRE